MIDYIIRIIPLSIQPPPSVAEDVDSEKEIIIITVKNERAAQSTSQIDACDERRRAIMATSTMVTSLIFF